MFGSRNKAKALVVGGGPVGMFAALSLARRDVPVRIVDKDWRTGAHSYALALHPRSLALLDAIGLAESVIAQSLQVNAIAFYDASNRRAEIRLGDALAAPARVAASPTASPVPAGVPATPSPARAAAFPFVAVLRQDRLESLLESALEKFGARMEWNHKVSRLVPSDDAVTATIDRLDKASVGYTVAHTDWVIDKTEEAEFPFVIGADGHLSTVRRALGLDFPEAGPPQQFAVFEFETDADLGGELRVILADDSTSVVWPMPDGRCRWSFELPRADAPQPARRKDRLMVQFGSAGFEPMEEDALRRLLRERAPWFTGSIGEVNWRMVVRFERRLVSSFGKDRLWLAGDAAHLTGPVGVQSMNAGLLEAAELADILGDTLRAGGPASPPRDRLAEYGRNALARWRRLLAIAGTVEPASAGSDPWIAANAARILPCLPATGEDLLPLLARIGLQHRGNPESAN